jgi:hypothetical protein
LYRPVPSFLRRDREDKPHPIPHYLIFKGSAFHFFILSPLSLKRKGLAAAREKQFCFTLSQFFL